MQLLQQLITSARDGEMAAFSEIVRRFQDMVFAYAYARVGDFHAAEDIAQEAFVDAFLGLPQLQHPEAFTSWLRQLVRSRCARLERRRGTRVLSLDVAGVSDSNPAKEVEEREQLARLNHSLNQLRDAERAALVLHYLDGYPLERIAVFLGVDVSTVKNRLRTARQKMRRSMLGLLTRHVYMRQPSLNSTFQEMTMTAIRQICIAAESGNLEKTRALLGEAANLATAKDERGISPLHYAAWHGHRAIAELLLDHGADIQQTDGQGYGTVISWARENGQEEMIDFLLEKGATISFRQAAGFGRLEIAQRMLTENPELLNHEDGIGYCNGLHEAVAWGHVEVVRFLLEQNADPNAQPCLTTALREHENSDASLAKRERMEAIVELLKQAGATERTNSAS